MGWGVLYTDIDPSGKKRAGIVVANIKKWYDQQFVDYSDHKAGIDKIARHVAEEQILNTLDANGKSDLSLRFVVPFQSVVQDGGHGEAHLRGGEDIVARQMIKQFQQLNDKYGTDISLVIDATTSIYDMTNLQPRKPAAVAMICHRLVRLILVMAVLGTTFIMTSVPAVAARKPTAETANDCGEDSAGVTPP